MAPADHGVDGILHGKLQLEGSLACLGAVILTGKKRRIPAGKFPRGGD